MLLALFAFARTGRLPALTHEAGFHARFLVTVPLLLAAETWLGYRIAAISTSFVPRRMLDGAAAASWTGLARRIERVGAASITELAIAVAVWGIALLDALRSRPSPLLKWLAPAAIGGAGEPLAQWWYVVVSQPVLLFLLARWLWRWLLWSAALVGLLWMHPRLNAKHPDRAGGTAFLTITLDAYQLVALAVGAAFAGTWADAIVKTGAEAATLAPMLVGYVAGALVIGFAAFLPFTPLLIHSRRRDTARYAVFAAQYLQAFDDKYLSSRSRDAVLGSSDIQSLSDLHNSYVIAADMRMTVFSPRDVSRVLAMAVLPTLILMIAIVPANEIAKRLLIFVIP